MRHNTTLKPIIDISPSYNIQVGISNNQIKKVLNYLKCNLTNINTTEIMQHYFHIILNNVIIINNEKIKKICIACVPNVNIIHIETLLINDNDNYVVNSFKYHDRVFQTEFPLLLKYIKNFINIISDSELLLLFNNINI